jgi:hypothetical protein
VFTIQPPNRDESLGIAQAIVKEALRRFGLEGRVGFERRALCLLAHMSPRLMLRAIEASLASAVSEGLTRVREEDLWATTRLDGGRSMLH